MNRPTTPRCAVRAAAQVLLVAAFLSAGCAPSRGGSLGPAPTGAPPTSTAAPAPTGAASPPPGTPGPAATSASPASSSPGVHGTVTVELWFTRANLLVPTRRTRPATVATSRLTLHELTAGPTPVEAAAGLTTAIPAGTTYDVAGIDAGVAGVDFSAAFLRGDPARVRLRQAQVVYSLTQFATVAKVRFTSSGPALGRGDFADLLPPIVVSSPLIGQRVSSPITIAGTADVFEATVSVRILDGTGAALATAFTTATCGSGCRGRYRLSVAYRSARTQPGTVEVYEVSARDGTPVHVTAVPVTLGATAR